MRKLFSSIPFMTAMATLVAVIGFVQSIYLKDFIWFSRSGSIIVGLGIVLLARTSIVKKDLLLNVTSSDTPFNLNSPEHFKALGEPVPDYVKNDLASRSAIGVVGPLISFIGTIIWGYGDLLNHLITKQNCMPN
jgi:hypothetical protein